MTTDRIVTTGLGAGATRLVIYGAKNHKPAKKLYCKDGKTFNDPANYNLCPVSQQITGVATTDPRPDRRCGPSFGNAKCGLGLCCSASGYCGGSLPGQTHCTNQGWNGTYNGTPSSGTTPPTAQDVSPTNCSPSSAGEYLCNKTLPSLYNLGAATVKANWMDCRTSCDSNTKCKGWVYKENKTCQLKNRAYNSDYQYQAKYMAGPRSGVKVPVSGTGGSGTTGGSGAGALTAGGIITPETTAPGTTAVPAVPAITVAPSTKGPLGLEWWMWGAIAGVLLLAMGGGGMMMMG